MNRAARAIPLVACLALAACARPAPHRAELYVLHTLAEVTVWSADADAARRQIAAAESALRDAEVRFDAWNDGELATMNAMLARGEPAPLSPELRDALHDAGVIARRTGFRFDPGIGRLVELWGFNVAERPAGPPPAAAELDALVARAPSIRALDIDEREARTDRTDVWVDLGAYAKGRAVDTALAALRANGANDALVAAAGDICALGTRGARPWRVGLRAPRGPGTFASLELADGECVSTSGDYERAFEWDAERHHHLLDPATGRPANGLASLTVVARRGALADAAATAGFVAGPDGFAATLRALGIATALAVRVDGALLATPAMRARVSLAGEPPPPVEVRE